MWRTVSQLTEVSGKGKSNMVKDALEICLKPWSIESPSILISSNVCEAEFMIVIWTILYTYQNGRLGILSHQKINVECPRNRKYSHILCSLLTVKSFPLRGTWAAAVPHKSINHAYEYFFMFNRWKLSFFLSRLKIFKNLDDQEIQIPQ